MARHPFPEPSAPFSTSGWHSIRFGGPFALIMAMLPRNHARWTNCRIAISLSPDRDKLCLVIVVREAVGLRCPGIVGLVARFPAATLPPDVRILDLAPTILGILNPAWGDGRKRPDPAQRRSERERAALMEGHSKPRNILPVTTANGTQLPAPAQPSGSLGTCPIARQQLPRTEDAEIPENHRGDSASFARPEGTSPPGPS